MSLIFWAGVAGLAAIVVIAVLITRAMRRERGTHRKEP